MSEHPVSRPESRPVSDAQPPEAPEDHPIIDEAVRERLGGIKARAQAATPGPWFVEFAGDFGDKHAVIECSRWRGLLNTVGFGEDFATAHHVAGLDSDTALWLVGLVEEQAAEVERLGRELAYLQERWLSAQATIGRCGNLAENWEAEALRYQGYAAHSSTPGEHLTVVKTLNGCAAGVRAAIEGGS